MMRGTMTALRRAAWMVREYVEGRTAGMTLPTIISVGIRNVSGQIDATQEKYSSGLRIIDRREDLVCYVIEHGRPIWAPAANDREEIAFLFAEHAHEPYFDGSHRVRPGDVVLDIGGNIGLFTRAALDHGAAHVVIMEPAPENIAALRLTFRDELAEGRVRLVEYGAWHESAKLTFFIDDRGSGHNSLLRHRPSGTRPITIPVTTVDALDLPRVDFIKIDVEGAEANVLKGGRQTLDRARPRLSIATEHSVTNSREVRAVLAQYRTWIKSAARVDRIWVPEIVFASAR